MNTFGFTGCCGLKIIYGFFAEGLTKEERLHHLRTQLRNEILSEKVKSGSTDRLVSNYQQDCVNSSVVAITKEQNTAFSDVLKEFGYELLREFPNWNEHKQLLYLYFREGGPRKDVPEVPPLEKPKAPKTTPVNRYDR